MRKLVLTCLISGISMGCVTAQTLFTYGPNSVSKEEFLRVYKKNSFNKKPDMSDTALRSYLDLYSLFRMKVAEADKEKLDTVKKIQDDLNNYRKQLAKNYLTDDKVAGKLVTEAYDRMKQDVHVEHILINCTPGMDTAAPYRKIDSIYQLITTGKATFEDMARKMSDDKGSKENGGDVGYFTALQTVYQFENVAYNTPVGKISKPFRTQFGYHIVKVLDKRADRGQVQVAQILFLSSKSKGEEGMAAAKMRADSVEKMIKSGTPFYELVKRYSDDKYSVNDSGVLKPFGAGRMTAAFENASFELKKAGDVSAPVRTEYGYHIIKLIKKIPLAPYDSIATQLKHKVDNDARAQTAREQYFNKVKEKNGFKEYPENVTEMTNRLIKSLADTGKNKGAFNSAEFGTMSKPLFTLDGKNYTQYDFVKHLENLTHGKLQGSKSAVVHDAYGLYMNSVVTDLQEHKLAEENPDFKNLMEEYRDGIMLFELMDRNVWSKATKDTAGLKGFYEARKSKYTWEPGFEGSVYTVKNKATLDTVTTMLKVPGMTDEQIVKALNNQTNPDRVSIQRGRYEFSKFKDATQAELTANKMKTITVGNGSYKLVFAKEIYTTPGTKSLDEARGYVVAEYQDYLEKQWNEKMRRNYPLKVNEAVFNTLKDAKMEKPASKEGPVKKAATKAKK